MGLRLSSLALTVALIQAAPLAAQEPLTLDQAIRAAAANNAGLRAVRAGAEEADARQGVARSGFFPRLSVSESWQRGDQPVYVFGSLLSARRFAQSNFAIDALNRPDATGMFRASVGLEQLLFDGGRQAAATRAALASTDAAHAASDEAAAAIVVAATQTFGQIVAAQAAKRSAEAALAAGREDLARAQQRRDAGVMSDADVLALEASVASYKVRAIQADGDAATARAELNRLMGRPVETAFVVTGPADSPDALATPALGDLLREADQLRPEIRRAAASVRGADAGRHAARAALAPQVAAQAAFDLSGTALSNRASAWLVGAEVRWSLSVGGAERAAIAAARSGAARARAEEDDARAAVHVDVATALSRLQTARARLAAGRAAVEQARESQRIIRDRFDAGLAAVSDVLRASAAVLDAESNQSSAQVDLIVSAALLDRAVGRNALVRQS